ncbi:MAG TPA: hypothetical protein VH206_10395 [Xanthobacteraceae bacterium]|jgi:hypothetical protein|nr:hypothetical protein [Xanthobacteraceae bacterium]
MIPVTILAPLFGTTLVLAAAAGPSLDADATAKLSPQQRNALTQPLVRSATDCIVHAVVSDPHYAAAAPDALGDLIVASMPACLTPVRAMIDAYDRYYGEGRGEAFFMGPYLDVLPHAVTVAGKKATP